MFKKKEKLRVGRPKLADSNLKKISLLISAICFVMVIGLIFGGLLDLNIIGNTHKLKAEANTSTLCTSIPDSLKYDENTNPYGFKDAEFFSGVLEHSRISGSNDYVYNDSKYCDTITKEDLEKIDDLYYPNNTISSANGIQYLTNLERLNLGTAADIPNYNITSIDLSHNTKLNSVVLSGLLNIKDFDFSNNTELSYIEIGRALYPTSYNINSLIIKNNSKLKTMTNALNSSYGVASILTGSINNLVIENTSLKKDDNSKFEVTENLRLENVDSSLLSMIKNKDSSDESYGLKKIYLKDINSSRRYMTLRVNSNRLDEVYIENSPYNYISLENKNSNPIKTVYLNNIPSLQELSITGNLGDNKIDFAKFPKLYTLNLFHTKISDIDLSNNSELETLQIIDSNLKQINLSNNKNLGTLGIDSTDIKNIDLSNNNSIKAIFLTRTGINTLDLSKLQNLQQVIIANNIDKDIYLKSNNTLDYNDLFNMNSKYNIKYESKDDKIASVLNGVIKGLKPGSTTILINNDIIESFSKKDINAMLDSLDTIGEINGDYEITKTLLEINVHVYDVTSGKYNIDDKTKVIDLKKNNIDLNEIKLGIDSLVKEVIKNKLYIKDASGNIIDKYTLVNKKEEEKENIKEEVKTTTKKKANSKKSSTKKKTTTTTIKSDNNKENTNEVTNEKVVEKITYKSNDTPLIIINIVEGILLLVLAILFIKSMRKSK